MAKREIRDPRHLTDGGGQRRQPEHVRDTPSRHGRYVYPWHHAPVSGESPARLLSARLREGRTRQLTSSALRVAARFARFRALGRCVRAALDHRLGRQKRENHAAGQSCLGAALLVAGCGGEPLADDPHGQRACELLSDSNASNNVVNIIEIGMRAGHHALRAETPAIADSVKPIDGLESFDFANNQQLEAACEDAGFEVMDKS